MINPEKKKQEEKGQTFSFQTLDSTIFTKKVMSQMLPEKAQKSVNKSSYQLYKEEQKQSKKFQRDKVIDWKESQWPKPLSKNSIRESTGFVRSKSYS